MLAPDGARVPIHWPLRLRSVSFNKRITVNTSNHDVFINSATGSSHLRINGPFVVL